MMDGYYSQMTHTCNYCNKVLPTYGDLVQHKKTHMGERPFSCHICHKRFTQKAHLNIHKRTHTGEKPYPCPICHKRFAQSSHLNSHRRIHADDRPYFCVVCNTGFSQKHRFDAHLPCMQQAKSRSSARISAALSSAAAASAAGVMSSYHGGGTMDGEMDVDQKPDVRYLDSLNQQALMQQLVEFSAASDSSNAAAVGSEQKVSLEEGEIDRNSLLGGATQSSPREESKLGISVTSTAAASSHRRKPSHIRHVDNDEGPGNNPDLGMADRTADNGAVNRNDLLTIENSDADGIDDKDDIQVHFQNGAVGFPVEQNQQQQHNSRANTINTGPMPANQSLLPTRVAPLGATINNAMVDSNSLGSHGRANHRISLVNFTAEELLRHMMSRGDVHRCDYCHLIFQDAAMYHIHRNMHDKNDLRCCNFCGKMLLDRYDFTAHFLNEHR
ncbi:uncharacterized protein LOC143286574 [Babylonia areolata]|uniref:uncharacterized protein LOC143286574 n=1 Tax=Babylonia areolata TaxID=304850 RepID=UPI003FD5FE8D